MLNRPATEQEFAAGVQLIQEMPKFHEQLAAELKDYEAKLDEATKTKVKQREEAIAKAKANLAAYEKKIVAREKKLDDQQKAKIAKAELAVKDYAKQLPEKLAAWEKKISETVAWTVLDPTELSSTNNAKFEKQKDNSIFVTGPNGKGTYKIVAKTEIDNVTGVRLELLTDSRLPKKGPGRAQNGNFVLTEFRVEWAPANEPNKKKPVALQNAQADYSQTGYDVKTAIDGKKAPTNNGWASAPKNGQNRTAVFETKTDVGPGVLTFLFDHEFSDGKHSIGRFRLSVTRAPRPVRLDGLPKNIADILAVALDKRNEKQKTDLLNYYRTIDSELKKLQAAVAEAKKPRPEEPKLKQLRGLVTVASRPLPVDIKLSQLRADVETSKKQLENFRLTAAQDLTWALINNPAFLFNH